MVRLPPSVKGAGGRSTPTTPIPPETPTVSPMMRTARQGAAALPGARRRSRPIGAWLLLFGAAPAVAKRQRAVSSGCRANSEKLGTRGCAAARAGQHASRISTTVVLPLKGNHAFQSPGNAAPFGRENRPSQGLGGQRLADRHDRPRTAHRTHRAPTRLAAESDPRWDRSRARARLILPKAIQLAQSDAKPTASARHTG